MPACAPVERPELSGTGVGAEEVVMAGLTDCVVLGVEVVVPDVVVDEVAVVVVVVVVVWLMLK